jgi:hypothetical protein
LEKAETEGKEIKTNVQYTLVPMINDQIGLIETLLTHIEMVAFHLTSSKKGNTAIQSHLPLHSHHSTASTEAFLSTTPGSGFASRLRGGSTGEINFKDLIDFQSSNNGNINNNTPFRQQLQQEYLQQQGGISSQNNSIHNPNTSNSALAGKAAGLSSITEALNLIESLRMDVEKMQMGIQLLTLSVTKLMDIVTTQPVCCAGLFDFLGVTPPASLLATINPSQQYSTHSVTDPSHRVRINREIAGSYTTSTNNILHQQQEKSIQNSHSGDEFLNPQDGGKPPLMTTSKKNSFNFMATSQNRKKGYENLGSKNFTIEGVDDYDD